MKYDLENLLAQIRIAKADCDILDSDGFGYDAAMVLHRFEKKLMKLLMRV